MARKPRQTGKKPPMPAAPEDGDQPRAGRPERKPKPETVPGPEPQAPPPPRDMRSWLKREWDRLDWSAFSWRGVAINITGIIVTVLVIVGVFLTSLNTPIGRRILIQYATGLKLNSGLKIGIDSLDGSLYGDMTIHGLKLYDPKGVFLQSDLVHLNWHPFGYLGKHIDIVDLSSPRVEMLRRPKFNPSQDQKQTGSLLPDLKIDVSRVKFDLIQLDQPVLGTAYNLNLDGAAHILHKQLNITANAGSDKGDRLNVLLNAAPDKNRLDIQADLIAPQAGVVAALAHVDKPMTARINGQGSWSFWQGQATANLGEDNLLGLAVTARDGVFQVKGDTHPDRLVNMGSTVLLQPAVAVDLTATMKNRALDSQLKLSSRAMAVTADGVVDFAANSFHNLQVHARLLDPRALGSDITTDDLRADLLLDGAMKTPRIDYDIKATRFAVGTIKLSGLTAKGKSRVAEDKVTIPLNAQLVALSGINDQVDPLLTHLKLDGDVTIDKTGHLSSNTLHLNSDRVKASGTLSGSVTDSNYAAKVKAALNSYEIKDVGTVNVTTEATVVLTNWHPSVTGTMAAQTTKISNKGVADFLGGNARITGGYAYGQNGVFSIHHVAGKAPDFTLLNADGSITAKGAIALKATAESVKYGPLDAVASGTLDAPQAVLHAPRPGLGAGIADVTANLATAPQGYLIKATGQSSYGPFSADTLIHTGAPLVIDIHQAEFAGINTAGTITQSAAGPFTGTLSLFGSGLTGTAILQNAGGIQGATVNALGNDVNLPGDVKVHIGRAIIAATVVLRDQPQINADVQAADVKYADFALSTARAKVVMAGTTGTIQAVAHGQTAVPFNLAVNGTIAPNLYTFQAQGDANGIPLHLDHAARVTRSGNDWVLAPVTVVMDQGKVDLAGRFGADLKVQARLNNMDLSVANLIKNDLGIAGTADGAVDFSQTGDGYPTAHASLKIDNFSRSSAAVASTPVSLVVDAQLNPNLSPQSNYVHAIVRQGGNVVGRIQADLSPSSAGPWINRIMNAGLSGGVRYNGPAAVPFSLTGMARQQLTGAVALAADFSGQVSAPRLNGVVKSTAMTYDNEVFGTRVSNIALDGHFTNDRLEVTSFSGNAGDGTIKGSGWLSLAADQHFPMKLHADLNNARLARSDSINSIVSGTLDVTNNNDTGATIAGDLRLPQLKYQVVRQSAAEVNVLDGVRRKGVDTKPQLSTDAAIPSQWKLDIRARAPNQIFVSGMGLDSEWSMDLRIQGTTTAPRVVGLMKVIRGNYTFAGRSFDLDKGTITFDGGPLTDPDISLQASADINEVTGIIKVSGTAQRPDIAFSSTPSLPQDEVLSRMLFGESVANISATEALQLASAVNGLNGGTDYLNPLGALRSATGIDRLRVVGADTATGRGTSLAAGKYLTNNVYVEIVTDTKGFTATQLEVALSRALSILSQTGNAGTAVSVKYSKDY